MDNRSLVERDLQVLWHPCTQMKDFESYALTPIRRGEGVWLEDFDGNRYIDAISSWWVNLFGHSNKRISDAIQAQAAELEHVIFASFSHEPGVKLAERLLEIAPAGLQRCFYADNGSSAVEVALKMSFHYWLNTGRKEKTRFVGLSNAYHGETLGALAVGDVSLYKETYEPLLLKPLTAPSPDCFYREAGESWKDYSLRKLADMEVLLEQQHQEICAVILEPLLQCAGSMRMYHPAYLSGLRALCDRYEVHLIADEIATGFGRTGSMFACEQANITPDFLCLSKGITGGFLPLSAVLTTEQVYQAFYDDYQSLKAFLHSHSYTANPLACAAALATLDIFATDNVIENNKGLAKHMGAAMAHLNDHLHIAEVRQTGMVLAAEMVADKGSRKPFPWQERRGMKVFEHGLKNEALLRPLGNVVYLMPPYIISEAEIDHLARIATEGIDIATRG
jgi:adenosylmethionine-8-amino-7-oxononanoate aminotransferase